MESENRLLWNRFWGNRPRRTQPTPATPAEDNTQSYLANLAAEMVKRGAVPCAEPQPWGALSPRTPAILATPESDAAVIENGRVSFGDWIEKIRDIYNGPGVS